MPRRHSLPPTSDSPAQTRAEVFLEALQHRVYASIGLSADDCQRREALGQQLVLPERLRQMSVELPAADFARYRAALFEGLSRDEEAPRPTRFERPHQYSILRELRETVERAVDRLGFNVPCRPVIGTLPTGTLQPLMVRVPDDREVVVLVDGSLLTYANLLAKAIAQALPCDVREQGEIAVVAPAEGWTEGVDPAGRGASRFVELMLASLDGQPSSAPAYLPDAQHESLAADLCDLMELFALAREYARLLDNDHLEARTRRRAVHGQAFEVLTWTPEQELKADCMGLALLLAGADVLGVSLAWAFWAADALLASFGILERAAWLLTGVEARAFTTPPPLVHDVRRRYLRELLRNWDGGEQAVAFADSLQPVLDALEGSFQAHLYETRVGIVAAH